MSWAVASEIFEIVEKHLLVMQTTVSSICPSVLILVLIKTSSWRRWKVALMTLVIGCMVNDKLKLNGDTTVLLIIGTFQQLSKVSITSVLYGLLEYQIKKLQRVQNMSARLFCK